MAAVHPSAQLGIAGSGPLLPDLLALSSHLGLNQCVRFLGFVLDLKGWLQAGHGFAPAFRWEGLPMARWRPQPALCRSSLQVFRETAKSFSTA
jgi:glycosyltransferase involved in cell wall biosynthesis